MSVVYGEDVLDTTFINIVHYITFKQSDWSNVWFCMYCTQDDIPETVRLTKERILKSLQGEIDDKVAKKQKQKVIKKYRMVKFFGKGCMIRFTYKLSCCAYIR